MNRHHKLRATARGTKGKPLPVFDGSREAPLAAKILVPAPANLYCRGGKTPVTPAGPTIPTSPLILEACPSLVCLNNMVPS